MCLSPADCSDDNVCTLDYCQAGKCYNPEDTSYPACANGLGHCFMGMCCVPADGGCQ